MKDSCELRLSTYKILPRQSLPGISKDGWMDAVISSWELAIMVSHHSEDSQLLTQQEWETSFCLRVVKLKNNKKIIKKLQKFGKFEWRILYSMGTISRLNWN